MTPTPGFHMAPDLEAAKRMIERLIPAPSDGSHIGLTFSQVAPDCWQVFRIGSLIPLGTITEREDGCYFIVLDRPFAL
jgi:hypothetical protein